MKNQITTWMLVFLTTYSYAQWIQVPSGTTNNLGDICFPSDSVGYIVGSSGTVLKSTDAGDSWTTVHSDSSLNFQSVYFTSENTGYAAGGNLYKTIDGGLSWLNILTDNQVIEVYFVNDTLGFASGSNLYRTTDAGNSWTSINLSNIFSSIFFSGDSVGYFIGGPDFGGSLYKTIDGGQTFIPITNGFQSVKESAFFINDTVGFMCGWYGGLLAKTVNGGMTWQQTDTVYETQCWDVFFADENTGYYIDNSGGTYLVKYTTNGGAIWSTQLTNAGGWLNALTFINPDVGFVVGDAGIIYKTINGGATGIHNFQITQNLAVYPNPFSSWATLYSNRIFKNATVVVYNSFGQAVKQINSVSGQSIVLSRDNLANGFYFVRVSEENKIVAVGKLIVTE